MEGTHKDCALRTSTTATATAFCFLLCAHFSARVLWNIHHKVLLSLSLPPFVPLPLRSLDRFSVAGCVFSHFSLSRHALGGGEDNGFRRDSTKLSRFSSSGIPETGIPLICFLGQNRKLVEAVGLPGLYKVTNIVTITIIYLYLYLHLFQLSKTG